MISEKWIHFIISVLVLLFILKDFRNAWNFLLKNSCIWENHTKHKKLEINQLTLQLSGYSSLAELGVSDAAGLQGKPCCSVLLVLAIWSGAGLLNLSGKADIPLPGRKNFRVERGVWKESSPGREQPGEAGRNCCAAGTLGVICWGKERFSKGKYLQRLNVTELDLQLVNRKMPGWYFWCECLCRLTVIKAGLSLPGAFFSLSVHVLSH